MNRYTRTFVASCPNDGQPIIYNLTIETHGRMIQVEHIVTATKMIKSGYHEQIADELHRLFGGRHVICARHIDVDIETVREDA